ncbi:MAG: cupin domain-containing protein [Alphaproteobacteria bacterium]|nr:cupin domain-containing protein [Alphaproteobacteria bacterium]
MKINANFDEKVILRSEDVDWVPSPLPGVDRKMLDRIGGEVARATSIVRYAPESRFSEHQHTGGEEFIVLDGVFSDDSGDYGPGSYVRNPPGTAHAPWSKEGCTIFVKLWQFDAADLTPVSTNILAEDGWNTGPAEGMQVKPLYTFDGEKVFAVKFAPGAVNATHSHPGGEEILVLEGSISDEDGTYPKGAWVRSPAGSSHEVTAGPEGAVLWIKHGHLPPDLSNLQAA